MSPCSSLGGDELRAPPVTRPRGPCLAFVRRPGTRTRGRAGGVRAKQRAPAATPASGAHPGAGVPACPGGVAWPGPAFPRPPPLFAVPLTAGLLCQLPLWAYCVYGPLPIPAAALALCKYIPYMAHGAGPGPEQPVHILDLKQLWPANFHTVVDGGWCSGCRVHPQHRYWRAAPTGFFQ
jgi:hypothetical protein